MLETLLLLLSSPVRLLRCSCSPPVLLLLLLASFSLPDSKLSEPSDATQETSREGKMLSVFTVVTFPNTVCPSSSSGRNGTCYTASECTSKGGASSGSCASSFGVCCVFEKTCSAMTDSVAENNTYFSSSGISKGSNCQLKVCKVSSEVCQLRLDFETFILNIPVTSVATTVQNGNLVNPGAYTLGGICHVDTFSVTSPGSTTIPTICGTNTGEHMYVPAAEQCNRLSANIGSTSTATSSAFSIKITQIPCNSPVLPPRGCLQYFYGSASGTINSYNYQSNSGVGVSTKSQLLANQHYSACVRTERSYCGICYWSTTVITGFHMSVPNNVAAIGLLGWDTNCGQPGVGIGTAFAGSAYSAGASYDYVNIPGGVCAPPSPTIANTGKHPADRYCGTELNCRAATNAAASTPDGTVCTGLKPFRLGVHSDGVEFAHLIGINEAAEPNNYGFNLNYFMKTGCIVYDASGPA